MTESTPASAAAGWYPAGVDGEERYWDGAVWTDQVRSAGQGENAPAAAAVPGWYADSNAADTERFWDGAAWTAQTRALPLAVPPSGAVTPKRPWYKRKGIVIPAAVVAGLIVVSGISTAINGPSENSSASAPVPASGDRDTAEVVEEEPEAPVTVAVPDIVGMTVGDARAAIESLGLTFDAAAGAPGDDWLVISQSASGDQQPGAVISVTAEAPVPPMSVAQESAIRSAESYLSFKGFSRQGLFEQLTSEYGEGFEAADAEFALAHIEQAGGVDWNQEAVEAAQSYLEFKGFSRQGLFDQLTSEYGEAFTADQANFALGQVGL